MNKNRIRLTESDLHRIVKESVQKILRESESEPLIFWRYTNDYNGETEERSLEELQRIFEKIKMRPQYRGHTLKSLLKQEGWHGPYDLL